MAQKLLPASNSFIVLKKQVIQKEKILGESFKLQKKTSDDNRKNAEREKSLNYEKKIENSFSFLGKGIRVPQIKKLGLFDTVKKFITNTLLGFITVRLLKYLPQLTQIFTTIMKVGDFIIDTSGKLLNGLVSFVDWGYKAYDNARGVIRNLGGEKAVSDLDSASENINKTLNTLFIAGMLFTDFGAVGTIGSAAGSAIDSGIDFIKDRVAQQAAQRGAQAGAQAALPAAGGTSAATTAGTTGGVAAGTAAAVIGGAGLLASAVGEGAFQLKKFGKGFGNWLGEKVQESNRDRNPITRFLKKGFFGWMKSTLGPALWILNGLGTTLDVIGAPFRYGIELIRFGIMKMQNNQKGLKEQSKNLGKFDARVRDGVREHFAFMSPIFKMIGMKGFSEKLETPGSFGSLYGERAVSDMGYYGGGSVKIKKFAGGGSTSGSPKQKEVNYSRTFEKEGAAVKPGSAVGGDKVYELFPNPANSSVMNPYEHMSSTYESLSGAGSLGPMLGLMIRVLLGDRVDNNEYKNIASSLNNLLLQGIYSESPQTYQRLTSNIATDKLTSIIEGSILKILDQRLGAIQNELRVQLGLMPLPGGTTPTADECAPCEGGSSAAVSGDAADKAVLDLIASVESDGYDSVNTSAGGSIGKPTQMTIEEIGRRGRGATGRYQHMPEFIVQRAIDAGIKPSEKFTPENQDKMTLHFLRTGHGLDRWKSGQMSDKEFAQKLSQTWRGLPYDENNQTYPDRYASRNKAHTTFANVLQTLQRAKAGGSSNIVMGSNASGAADSCVCDPTTPDGDPGSGVGGVVGPSNFIQGNSGASYGIHFHIAPGSYLTGDITSSRHNASARQVAFQVAKFFAGKKSIYLGRSGVSLSGKESDSDLRNKIQAEQVAHTAKGSQGGIDLQVGGAYYPGAAVKFPLQVEGMKYRPGGFGVTAKVVGADASVAHGRYDETGKEAPQEGGRMYQVGGPTGQGGMALLHKGEYVIDKDSVDIFGGQRFFQLINKVENDSQRASASRSLISLLAQYTGRKIDQNPKVIIDDTEDEVLMMPPYYVNNMNGSTSSGEAVNCEQDMCYARG